MQRRLLIGGVVTVVVVALSLLPTDSLRLSRPSKPLFFYLVPLIRVQNLLKDLEAAAIDGKPEGGCLGDECSRSGASQDYHVAVSCPSRGFNLLDIAHVALCKVDC